MADKREGSIRWALKQPTTMLALGIAIAVLALILTE